MQKIVGSLKHLFDQKKDVLAPQKRLILRMGSLVMKLATQMPYLCMQELQRDIKDFPKLLESFNN